jgi:predicted permease
LIENVRFALRQLYKNPGFATLAILTLALGIGANTAMFTVLDSVLLRSLPFRDADRLVVISPGEAIQANSVQNTSWPNYLDIRQQARQLANVAAYTIDVPVIRTEESSRIVVTVKATASLFDVLGVRPVLGRPFLDSDNQPGAANVILLSSGFWREHFASDSQVVGQQVKMGNQPYTIIGVLPESLRFPIGESDTASGVWIPFKPDADTLTERNSNFLTLIGTLRPGVSQQAAQAEVSSIARGIAEKDPKSKDLTFHVTPYQQVVTASVKPVFLALTGALALVLLIACANVANLQLARCLARSQELAVRTALGASRRALLAQMLIEGGVVCAFGAAVGVALALLMLKGIHQLPPDLIPRTEEIHLRLSVFLVLLAVAAVSTLLSSIAPALVAMRSDPQAVLQQGSRGTSSGPQRSRLSSAMVAGEVALSVILLISSGLMFRTLYKLQHIYLGFDENNVTSFIAMPGSAAGFFAHQESTLTDQADSIAVRVYAPMLERLRTLPGVMDGAFTNAVPFEGIDMHSSFGIVGRPKQEQGSNKNSALIRVISGAYIRVIGTPIVQGRSITDEDTSSAPYAALINETFAKRYFAGQNPVGQQISLAGKEMGMVQPYTIVGVTADSIQTKIAAPVIPELDLPYQQVPVSSFYYPLLVTSETNYVLKTHGPVDVASAVRNAFHESAPDFALDNFTTMRAAHELADISQRIGLYLIGTFAGIAMVMVLAGLYGVLSQIVGQRRREIGIRMALGADRAMILRIMLRRGIVLIGLGLGVGLLASVATEQSLRSFLYGVSPVDAVTYVSVTAILLVVGILAALIPARRAASIEPSEALRAE